MHHKSLDGKPLLMFLIIYTIVVFDIVFFVVSLIVFDYIIEE